MTKLTQEQKAKRYDYIENAILSFLEEKIENAKYDDPSVRRVDVAEKWIDRIDFHGDIIPREVYLIFDKILDEHFDKFIPLSACIIESIKKEYKEFEEKIGG